VLNNLTAWAVATGKVHIKSDGTPWRPIVHVEDISRAFLAALQAPREVVHGEAFNVARPDGNYRIRELAEIVHQTVPGCEVEFAADASPDTRNYRVDSSKILSSLPGFEPQWTAQDGARQLYEAFAEQGISLEEVEGWRFRRIGQIKRLMDAAELGPDLRWKAR
jgi:nucleoside-diphosphate-sugar epimerase